MASLYSYIMEYKRFGKFFKQSFSEIKKTEFFSNEMLQEIQFSRLKSFIDYAFKNSSYYQKIFRENNVNPNLINSFSDLKKLPILTKEDIRQNAEKISCKKFFKKTIDVKTSGTTGKPLKLVITEDSFQLDQAYQQLLYSWYGFNKKTKMAKCAGQAVTPIEKNKPPFWVTDFYNNNIYLSSYHLTENNLRFYINKLKNFCPEIIEGYPSSIYLLALANNKFQAQIRPKFIRTGSETLLDHHRNVIEESFRCNIHNYYGSGENCVTAIECPKGKMHLQMLYGYTELINNEGKDAKPGEVAKIIATGFSNYAFPLIRYDIGDLAILSDVQTCDCGRGGILLDNILGRDDDYLLTPEYRIVRRLGHIFNNIEGVINAQIIQDDIEEVIFKIVKDHNYNNESEIQVLKNARERIGREINIRILYVNDIPRQKNGKFKYIVSNIDKELFGEKLKK